MTEWIDVNDRQPTREEAHAAGQGFLVNLRRSSGPDVTIAWFDPLGGVWNTIEDVPYIGQERSNVSYRVTHWAYITNPPQTEETP